MILEGGAGRQSPSSVFMDEADRHDRMATFLLPQIGADLPRDVIDAGHALLGRF